MLRTSGDSHRKERTAILHFLGALTTVQGDFTAAHGFVVENLALQRGLEDRWGIAISLNAMAVLARDREDYAAAQHYFEESLALLRELGANPVSLARCLHNLANVVKVRGDFARARTILQEATQLFRQADDFSGAAWCLNQQGDIAREQGELEMACEIYELALAAFRDTDDGWGIARTLTDLGYVACDCGDQTGAGSLYRQALEAFQNLRHQRGIARVLEGFARSACAQSDGSRALRLAASAAKLRHKIGAPLPPAEQAKLEQALLPAWQSLPEAEARAAWEEGSEWPLEKAIECSLGAAPTPGSTDR
jgi:tetratricopeptide (TPR) repeat protein